MVMSSKEDQGTTQSSGESKTGGKGTAPPGLDAGPVPASKAHLPPDLHRRNKASAKSSLEAMLKGAGQEPQGAAATPGAEQSDDDLKPYVQPCASPSGVDDKGQPDGSLSDKQVERAATEALHALRPQPPGPVIASILDKLAERDEKGQPKQRFKSAEEVIGAARGALKEQQDETNKQADADKKARSAA